MKKDNYTMKTKRKRREKWREKITRKWLGNNQKVKWEKERVSKDWKKYSENIMRENREKFFFTFSTFILFLFKLFILFLFKMLSNKLCYYQTRLNKILKLLKQVVLSTSCVINKLNGIIMIEWEWKLLRIVEFICYIFCVVILWSSFGLNWN